MPAADGYEVTLERRRVIARKSGGTALKSLPKPIKDADAVVALRQLQEWLDRHEDTCRAEVEAWLVRSLPVPFTVLVSVWPDPAWRTALADLVAVPVIATGWDLGRAGLLRDVDPDRGVGLVNLDGDSVWCPVESVALPHPVLLEDLEDLREFASDLGVTQVTRQLFREIWRRPEDPDERAAALRQYAGGRFAQLRHLVGRAVAQGYPVRGGYATARVWESGRAVLATVWVGVDDPSMEAETGELIFTTVDGTAIVPAEVGAVSWSEGMRMAASLYAGRVVDEAAA